MTALQLNAQTKAEKFVKLGEKAESKWYLLNPNKWSDAVKHFEDAATQYKIAKKSKESGDYFLRAAKIAEEHTDNNEACSNYVNAGMAYRTVDPNETARVYNIAIKIYLEKNRFTTAAKYYKELAEIAVDDYDMQTAIERFNQAAECYESENSISRANQCYLKVAELSAKVEDYPTAIAIYEKIALSSLDNNLLKWSVKDYYFRALLCQMAVDAKTQEFDTSERAHSRYMDLDPSFEGSRECKLIGSLLEACKDRDTDKFGDLTKDFDRISKLDEWKTSILFQVKSCLGEEAEDDEAFDDLI